MLQFNKLYRLFYAYIVKNERMKNMKAKRTLATALSALLVLSLCACSAEENTETTASNSESVSLEETGEDEKSKASGSTDPIVGTWAPAWLLSLEDGDYDATYVKGLDALGDTKVIAGEDGSFTLIGTDGDETDGTWAREDIEGYEYSYQIGSGGFAAIIQEGSSIAEADSRLTNLLLVTSDMESFVLFENDDPDFSVPAYTGGSSSTTKSTSNSASKSSSSTYSSKSSSATKGEQNALARAQDYLEYMAFSRSGLIDQLEYEGYTTSEATYAVDHCGADWNEQAAKKAKEYLDYSSFSRSGLIDQLEYEGFTQAQAEYGVKQNGY